MIGAMAAPWEEPLYSAVSEARSEGRASNWRYKERACRERDIMSLPSPPETLLLPIVEGQGLLTDVFSCIIDVLPIR